MSNRIESLFSSKQNNILSVYFTAGYPSLNDTISIIQTLEKSGVDLIEIGMPFSDPLADGPVIQESSMTAINNGMTIHVLFEQLKEIRNSVKIPLVLMGYINPVMQYGMEEFAIKASQIGIDGVIIPDLPLAEYMSDYKTIFFKNNLKNIFLITPQTSEERIRLIDNSTDGFIYMVSSASITGSKEGISDSQLIYFDRIRNMNLKNARLIGFGISNHESFASACQYANGAIIGTAFIKAITGSNDVSKSTEEFVKKIKG